MKLSKLCFLSVFLFVEMNASQDFSGIERIGIQDQQQREYRPFPISAWPEAQPCNPIIAKTYIDRIRKGHAYSLKGMIFSSKGELLKEFIWPNDIDPEMWEQLQALKIETLPDPEKISGKVAVITQGGQWCYYHWLTEILGRLIMLEKSGISYDKIYVAVDTPFKKESLKLWGIADDKIIEPYGSTKHIEADELIVPSLVDQVVPNLVPNLANYVSPEIVQALRAKFLPIIKDDLSLRDKFCKKIFISRQDAAVRKVANEDEVFERFENLGFVRYKLSELSFKEQVALFYHAEQIVAVHGAGIANTIFSQPGTQLIEIFQARSDATYWYLSQQLGLKHTCIKTQEFDEADPKGFVDTEIPAALVDKMITALIDKP